MESLQKEYCPPLDEALFYAVALDYDIEDKSQLAELKAALNSLKESAIEEQDLELLPPPTSPPIDAKTVAPTSDVRSKGQLDSSQLSHSSLRSTTDGDAATSISTALSGLALSKGDEHAHGSESSNYGEATRAFEELDADQKVQWLTKMFPSVSGDTIAEVLSRTAGDFDQSTDQLLNISFMNDEGIDSKALFAPVAKGVDGFIVSENEGRVKRKTKGRSRRHKNHDEGDESASWYSDSAQESATGNSKSNVWATMPRDVEFIASRTSLKPKTIASIYHANGARLSPTLRALINKEATSYTTQPKQFDELIRLQIEELKLYFENLPAETIYGALTLCNKIPSAAKELLEAMLVSNEEPVLLGKVNGMASYAPLDLSDHDDNTKRSLRSTPWTTAHYGTGNSLNHMANTHGVAAASAFDSASAAHRRGRSDRLMGGAAAYYASVGHDHVRAAKVLQQREADSHVAQQSSSTVLDLHGVNVAQAVRIAQDGTEAWWDGLGDRKYVPVGGIGGGYKIITGVGRHSADGIGRIGPAVSKMLVREGWKVEVGRGEIIVSGKVRKR